MGHCRYANHHSGILAREGYTLDKIIVRGGKALAGNVKVSGAKNAVSLLLQHLSWQKKEHA
ncbi:UDP-N-acetylglucosamine 1-carboxyvinyltransferase [Citrobacter freundii ATCC 8090 = MTCC 1658 = NBRC 12681]|uniref:hypothetical protein n=1 Tax=Citrobacter freundii TaxID=546 RepID=UPI000299B1CC|nr:UDP-N-acetylglucosamine 1-carboxyvinyltransferase [Citrobacter freundii ATCC 8090 = MTCC 1658 = NBRC 12681]